MARVRHTPYFYFRGAAMRLFGAYTALTRPISRIRAQYVRVFGTQGVNVTATGRMRNRNRVLVLWRWV